MIHHIVFWKMKADANGATAEANAKEMKRLLNALQPLIPQVRSLSVGLDLNRSEAAWDVALYTTFDSMAGLQAYQIHPEHKMVVEFVSGVVASRAVVDFEA
jgi:hypothetical protein